MKVLKLVDKEELRYNIFPPKGLNGPNLFHLQEQTFNFWRNHWESYFKLTGLPEEGWQNDYLKQDVIVSITHREEIVGCHMYTFYNLSATSTRWSKYFESISDSSFQTLKVLGFKECMSMEYLSVSPEYKKNSLGISFGKVLGALGTHLAEDRGADCALGMPIMGRGNKVSTMFENVGAKIIQEKIEKFGYQLNLMAAKTNARVVNKDSIIEGYSNKLWDRKMDHFYLTGETFKNSSEAKNNLEVAT